MVRRRVLEWLLAAGGAALAWAWAALGLEQVRRARGRRVALARPASDGVTSEQGVILVRAGAELRAYSARCPHLGCRISRAEAGVLVCPCHGSRFDARGARLSGPAAGSLTPLAVEERGDGRIDVVLPS